MYAALSNELQDAIQFDAKAYNMTERSTLLQALDAFEHLWSHRVGTVMDPDALC